MTWLLLALSAALLLALWRLRALSRELQDQSSPPPPPEPTQRNDVHFLDIAMQALDVGLVVVDPQAQVKLVNPAALTLLDREAHDVLDRNTIVLLRDYHADTLVYEVLQSREARELILQPVLSQRTLQLHILPLEDGGVLLLLRDLTKLTQLERARRDLVANVSHELRTPLASLQLLVETLRQAALEPRAQQLIATIQTEIEAMTKLVDDLHKLSLLESGRYVFQFRPLAPGVLIERVVERLRQQAATHDLQLAATVEPGLPPIFADQDRLEQALVNLVHNAIKFTPSKGAITIAAAAAQQEGEQPDEQERWVEIAVRDTGPGIPQDVLPRVFERFYKADRARTRGMGGTGLGLAITKHIVEGHGGRIWAESTPGEGSSFYLRLPAADVAAEADGAAS